MKATTKKFIEDMASRKVSYSKAKAALEAVGHAENAKDADKILAEAKYPKASGKGFTPQFYDYIKEKSRTDDECLEFIKANGNENTYKARKHFIKINQLLNDVRNQK